MSSTTVKSFKTADGEGRGVTFTVDSQLLDYLEPARTFGSGDLAESTEGQHYQPTVVAIPDHRSETLTPMMLSKGSDGTLRLIRRVSNGAASLPSGYELVNLSDGFAHITKGKVRAFAAAWTAEDEVTLAVAVESSGSGSPSQVLIAYDVSTKHGNWAELPWVNYGTRDALQVDGIRVIREPDGKWLTLMSGAHGDLSNCYVIRQGRPGTFQTGGMVYSTAIDLTAIADFQVGGVDGDAAMHVLGTNFRGRSVVVTRKIPTLDATGHPVATPFLTFPCPDRAKVMAMGLNRVDYGADLYVGGKGVHRLGADTFDEQDEAEFEVVIAESVATGIQRLVVTESTNGATTVWALDSLGRLWITSHPERRQGQKVSRWGEPLVLRRDVHEIAAVPGDGHLTASVLVIYDKGDACGLVRDAEGIWQDEPITIADAGAATRLLTFQTVVSLKDHDYVPARGRVRLSASVASTLVVNGHSHFLYPGNDAVLDIPYDGKLTISNRALSFSPATYRVSVEGWQKAIDINPAAGMYQRFNKLTADDLRNAKKADGQPLLGEEFRSGGQAGSIDSLLQALKKAAEISTAKAGGIDGVWLVEKDAGFSSKVEASALPDGYSFGISSNGKGGVAAMSSVAANGLADQAGHASAGFAGASLSLSDIWESIAHAAGQAVRFVIRKAADVVEFVCEIAGKVGRFILNRLEEIGSFFAWLWRTVKTAAEDAWNFLKFLFNWDDIIAVRNWMRTGVEDQLKAMKKSVEKMKPVIAGYFDDGIQEVRKAKADRGLSNRVVAAKDPISEARKGGDDAKDTTVNSGPGSWILEQFANIGKSIVDFKIPPTDSKLDFMKTFSQQLDTLSSLSHNVGKDIQKIFPGGFPGISDLTFDKLEKVVMSVGLNLAEGALELGKGICLALLDVVVTLIDTFHAVMFTKIRLPLMEKLWELVSGEKKDLSFSFIDLALLPAALLSTITFKLAFPKLDIKKVLEVRLPTGDVVAVQSSGLMAAAQFIKEIMATWISFVGLMFDSLSAAAELIQAKVGWFSWLTWTLGFLAHVIPSGFITGAKKALGVVILMEWLGWTVGFAQHAFKYYKNALPMLQAAAYAVEAKFVAAFDVVSGVLRCVLKTVAILVDKDSNYPVLEMVQFYGNSLGKVLNAAARLIDESGTKTILAAGTMIVAMFVGLVPGIVHNIKRSQAAMA